MKVDRRIWFDEYRKAFGPLRSRIVQNMEAFLTAAEPDPHNAEIGKGPGCHAKRFAYLCATAYHETGRDFEPRDEYDKGGDRPYAAALVVSRNQWQAYYGRGLVQLTWLGNYAKMSLRLGVDFVNNPQLAGQYPYAYQILSVGSHEGIFTGMRLSHYFTETVTDPVNARRIINGTDKAELIAEHYEKFLTIIKQSLIKE